MSLSVKHWGLGDPHAQFNVYIANSPSYSDYANLHSVSPLVNTEIHVIGQACGNGWRKVFNVYAKLLFALNCEQIVSLHGANSWQSYRDHALLQHSSNTRLLFSPPNLIELKDNQQQVIHIIMGKTYAKSLNLPSSLTWLDNEFAIDIANQLLVCPYFDYRQLSNIKIIRLVELIRQLS